MKVRNTVVLMVGLVVLSVNAMADTTDIVAANNQYGVQYVRTNVDYAETAPDGSLYDTEIGPVKGYGISISSMRTDDIYWQIAYDRTTGATNYTGAYMGGTYGSVVTTSGALLSNLSARVGKGIEFKDKYMLTPYVEFGRHIWDRSINYGETYSNNWYGIGALGQLSPTNRLVLTANAMVGSTTRAAITVGSGPGLDGFSGDLGSSAVYKAGFSADYAFSTHFHGSVGIDYTAFKYGISAQYQVNPTTIAWEPDSRTSYTTFKLGLGYGF